MTGKGRKQLLASENKVPVLIVGAGPVGLTAAAELARFGVSVRLIDQLPGPSDQSRAVALQARTLESVYPLRVVDELIARGRQQTAAHILDGFGERLAGLDFAALPSRYPFVLDLPQPETEDVLRQAAQSAGVTVEYATALKGLTQTRDRVDVVLETPRGLETETAEWVIGADGAKGATRHLTGQRYADFDEGDVALLADVEADIDFPMEVTTLISDALGERSIHPMQGSRVRLGFAAPGADPATTPSLRDVQSRCTDLYGGKVRVRDAHWLSYYRSRSGLVPHLRVGRVLLAGDAAHVHPPAGGQGMNLGIQDAVAAAWRLSLVINGVSTPELLDEYDLERHAVAKDVVQGARKLSHLMMGSGPFSSQRRRAALFALAHLPGVARRRAEDTAQLTVDYSSHGTIMRDARQVAGRRFPNVHGLRDQHGAPIATEDLLTSPAYTRIQYDEAGGNQPSVPRSAGISFIETTVVVDGLGELENITGHSSGMILVRPDGYVAASTDLTNANAVLAKYLQDHLQLVKPKS